MIAWAIIITTLYTMGLFGFTILMGSAIKDMDREPRIHRVMLIGILVILWPFTAMGAAIILAVMIIGSYIREDEIFTENKTMEGEEYE